MISNRIFIICFCVALLALASSVLALNPITNPSFESGLTGWTAYSYSVAPSGSPALPLAGGLGAGNTFDVLYPNPPAPDGVNVCGMQAQAVSKNGGVCQTFTWSGATPRYITVTARCFSETFSLTPSDNGCRVRMGLVPYATTDRNAVGTSSWTVFTWGNAWNRQTLTVPDTGTYTLFIEGYQPNSTCIMSTLWDNVQFMPPIHCTSGPTVTADPAHPDTGAIVTWTTDAASSSEVDYGLTTAYGQSVVNSTLVTNHSVTLSGLTHSSTYHLSVKSSASDYLDYTSGDIVYYTPIQISNVTTQLAATQVYPDSLVTVISWTTDAPCTSQVQYGTTTSYGTTTPENTTLTTSHSVTISGLAETTNYHFCVVDRNQPLYTNVASGDQTFVTLPAAGATLRNGDFELPHGLPTVPSFYPWSQYTTYSYLSPIDGIIGPYPQSGSGAWLDGIKAFSGSYFVGAAVNGTTAKNGGVFQRLWCTPGQLYVLSAHYATYVVGTGDTDNEVRLGIDTSGGTNPLSSNIQWAGFYSPLDDAQWCHGAVSATAGSGGLVSVFLDILQQWSVPWHICAVDDAVFSQPQPMKIGQLKSTDGNLGASLNGEIVTYVTSGRITYGGQSYLKVYAQESDRTSGIALLLPGYSPVPVVGNKISAVGKLALINQEDTFVGSSWTLDSNHYTVRPLALNLKSVGGFTANQPKLNVYGGLSNVGLVVRVFGKVTSADMPGLPGFDVNATIYDGSGLMNQEDLTGLTVFLAGGDVGINIGDYVSVTGVLTVQTVNSANNPYIYKLLTNDPNQWSVVLPAPQ